MHFLKNCTFFIIKMHVFLSRVDEAIEWYFGNPFRIKCWYDWWEIFGSKHCHDYQKKLACILRENSVLSAWLITYLNFLPNKESLQISHFLFKLVNKLFRSTYNNNEYFWPSWRKVTIITTMMNVKNILQIKICFEAKPMTRGICPNFAPIKDKLWNSLFTA